MPPRALVVSCLVFSGLSALVYQIIWIRLLGLTFGTSTEAISSVLAVFFGGLAFGNLIAARHLERVVRPLRAYALLEVAVGAFALVSLPLLRHLHVAYAWLGVPESELGIESHAVVVLVDVHETAGGRLSVALRPLPSPSSGPSFEGRACPANLFREAAREFSSSLA